MVSNGFVFELYMNLFYYCLDLPMDFSVRHVRGRGFMRGILNQQYDLEGRHLMLTDQWSRNGFSD